MGSMDSYVKSVDTLVDQGKDISSNAEGINDQFKDTENPLKEVMELDIDADLKDSSSDALEAARDEALSDLEQMMAEFTDSFSTSARDVKGQIDDKIKENDKAGSVLSSIGTDYGADSISKTSDAIKDNTAEGNAALDALQDAENDTKNKLDAMKDSISG